MKQNNADKNGISRVSFFSCLPWRKGIHFRYPFIVGSKNSIESVSMLTGQCGQKKIFIQWEFNVNSKLWINVYMMKEWSLWTRSERSKWKVKVSGQLLIKIFRLTQPSNPILYFTLLLLLFSFHWNIFFINCPGNLRNVIDKKERQVERSSIKFFRVKLQFDPFWWCKSLIRANLKAIISITERKNLDRKLLFLTINSSFFMNLFWILFSPNFVRYYVVLSC